ncbi:molybdopterin-binding protein [Methylocaldum marinum]|uniref:hypothetical protein n=1 Tax=Methylocaldum marinum TaxID=1432792 RepID=UPI0011AE492C|nr:hypothetical protein [Methylocaldum marinum]
MSIFKSNLRTAAIASAFLLTLSAAAQADVALAGFLNAGSPSSFSITDLQSFGSTATVTVGDNTYTGVSLYSYLNTYLATDPTVPKNDILRDYVVATGASGTIVYSLGNLADANFGTQNSIIAFSDSNGALSAPSLIATDGAHVFDLTSLSVGHVDYPGLGTQGPSTSFSVFGDVSNPTTYTAAELPGSLAPHTEFTNPDGTPLVAGGGQGFTGVSLWDLLVAAGISTNPATLLKSYVVATGTDNYASVFGLEEIMPQYGNRGDLVAYANGSGGSLDSSGFARIVVPGDTRGGRYVSNLVSLEVVTVPVPPAVLLMLSGACVFVFTGRRQRSAA